MDEASSYIEKAVSVASSAYGKEHPAMASVLNERACLNTPAASMPKLWILLLMLLVFTTKPMEKDLSSLMMFCFQCTDVPVILS